MKHILMVPSRWVEVDGLDTWSRERCDVALTEWRKDPSQLILLSGGKFRKGQQQTAARMMFDYLRQLGVPEEQMLLEELSVDTYENVRFSQRVLRRALHEPVRITVVSDFLHGLRFHSIFWAHGVSIRVKVSSYRVPLSQVFVELAAILWTLVDRKGKGRWAKRLQNSRRQS